MTYNHITNWDVKSTNLEGAFSADWNESKYWQHKQIATNQLSPIVDNVIGSLQEVMSILGKTMDLSLFSQEMQRSKYYAELLKEYIFEDIRVNEFPEKPSRKKCMFLLPPEIDPMEYGRQLNYDMTDKFLLEIEVLENSKVHYADLKLLDCNAASHPDKIESARKYWTGTTTRDFTTEVLFVGAFKIKQILQR